VTSNAYFLIQLAFKSVLFCSYWPARRGNAHKRTQGVVARKDFPRRASSFSPILFQLNRALYQHTSAWGYATPGFFFSFSESFPKA